MRTTWDAAAASNHVDDYVGDPATAQKELDSLFSRLDADPRGGTCVEVGCGPGRMTGLLADRFDRVIGVDVSPAMLELVRGNVRAGNVEFVLVSGGRLDPLESGVADVVLCYLVLQHLPRRELVASYLEEFARVLAPAGRAFVQIPILSDGLRPRAWRALRGALVPLARRIHGGIEGQAAYRGFRLTGPELDAALEAAGLRITARDESGGSPYRYAREVFLRLEHR
jgi:SAM-dependent methyltransferase